MHSFIFRCPDFQVNNTANIVIVNEVEDKYTENHTHTHTTNIQTDFLLLFAFNRKPCGVYTTKCGTK